MTAATPVTGDLRDALHRQIAVLSPDHRAIAERMAEIVEPIIADLAAAQAQLSEVERERDEALAESLSHQSVRSSLLADARRAERARDAAQARVDQLEAAIKPFAALSFSFDGFGCDPAELVFKGRVYGRFDCNHHAAFQSLIDAARTALARTEASTESTGGRDAG